MGFNEFISKIFGNKASRDMKEIQPWVEKVKAVYPEISKFGCRRKQEDRRAESYYRRHRTRKA